MRERELSFRAGTVLSAVSLIASIFENFADSVGECSVSHAGDAWPVTIRLKGSQADELYAFLITRLTSRGEIIRDDA